MLEKGCPNYPTFKEDDRGGEGGGGGGLEEGTILVFLYLVSHSLEFDICCSRRI